MNFLITRSSTYDMAGLAMIEGAMTGLSTLYPWSSFGALVFARNRREWPHLRQWTDPGERDEALLWADCCLDIGGLCKGSDGYREAYIKICRAMDIPYIYMAVSFEHPDPAIVKDVPATARGHNSCREYAAASGKNCAVVPDLSFMLEPERPDAAYQACYTTHNGKPWECWGDSCLAAEPGTEIQAVFKPPKDGTEYEPLLGLEVFHGTPSELYGLIGQSRRVYTCRYHAAVAAIIGGRPYEIPAGMPNIGKYQDLGFLTGLSPALLSDYAMQACYYVKEVLDG